MPHRQTQPTAATNVYVASLPATFTDQELFDLMSPFGSISSARVMCEPKTGQCKGYGFVLYEQESSAAAAVQGLAGYAIAGHRIQVRLAHLAASPLGGQMAAPVAAPPPAPSGVGLLPPVTGGGYSLLHERPTGTSGGPALVSNIVQTFHQHPFFVNAAAGNGYSTTTPSPPLGDNTTLVTPAASSLNPSVMHACTSTMSPSNVNNVFFTPTPTPMGAAASSFSPSAYQILQLPSGASIAVPCNNGPVAQSHSGPLTLMFAPAAPASHGVSTAGNFGPLLQQQQQSHMAAVYPQAHQWSQPQQQQHQPMQPAVFVMQQPPQSAMQLQSDLFAQSAEVDKQRLEEALNRQHHTPLQQQQQLAANQYWVPQS